ncbi:Ceramide kinase [Quillaja saponaria]|uniref:Ceramide kinase n=1 Tax=Quillaja saponaria TaxID=32244 RepID=A0AAD7L259_QUISA|nr:Ceramide kinase [Quillaja saponaria]
MERDGNDYITGDESEPRAQFDGEASVLSSNLFLDHVGEVTLTSNSNGLSWKLVDSLDNDDSTCLGIKFVSKVATEIKLSDIYAVELIHHGSIHLPRLQEARRRLLGHEHEMYRFVVHGVQRSKSQPSFWVLAVYTFGHKSLQTCQLWVNHLNASLSRELGRPRNLLVFVHPRSGKGNGYRTWETVAPIFSRAKVNLKVIVTQRAGHAFDMMSSISNKELNFYDGVVAVGGDGFFNEILNGILSLRHKAPNPPTPSDFIHSVGESGSFLVHDPNETVAESAPNSEDQFPLLSSQKLIESGFSNSRTEDGSNNIDKDPEFPIPNERFRFGIIPAGSTDAIVMCTTGARDPITSALQIVLGKKVRLDIAQIVRWKTTPQSEVEPSVRYAASFAGYGFYGDVIKESEKYRWMGPVRYDYAGTQVFVRHRSYEAEIAYLKVKSEDNDSTAGGGQQVSRKRALGKSEKCVCRVNCRVCSSNAIQKDTGVTGGTPYSRPEETRWLKSKGRFLSIGAAIISCRNERAPDGLVADAHLSDGFLHLILIKDCPHASYLWHLTQLARKGGNPLNFKFVEHHKTLAFTFTSLGNESVWNVDGEVFLAHQLSAQVFRGLISLFASGPEV